VQFVAAGPIFVLPIIKYWLKDTNMVQDFEALDGAEVGPSVAAVTERTDPKKEDEETQAVNYTAPPCRGTS
jgi:hypothetical protein